MRIPFGKPFPAIDSTSLRDGVAAGLVNGYINELDDYQIVPGHTLFATYSVSDSVDSMYETLGGAILAVIGGVVVRVQSDGTFTAFTGDTVTPGVYCYWAEDGQHVYLAHGGKLARVDMANLTVELMNQNTPDAVTHVVRAKGYLGCNGREVVIASSRFDLAQVYDNAAALTAVTILDDMPGWIVAGGQGTFDLDDNAGRIYLSKDNGITWARVYSSLTNNEFHAIEYMGSGVVLAGTAFTTGEIFRSTDYGLTWTDMSLAPVATNVNFIRKLTSTIAIAGTGDASGMGRLYRTTDAGITWSDVGTAFGKQVSDGGPITEDASVVVVAAMSEFDQAQVWRSTNTGASFSQIIQPFPGAEYITFVQRITDEIAILSNGFLTGTTVNDQKIWRSVDAGLTWADIGPIPGFNDNCLPFASCVMADGSVLFGTAGNNLAVGGAQLWKSVDQGKTWGLLSVLNDGDTAAVAQNGLKETHIAGTIIATGRVAEGRDGTATAAKWQTAVGKNAPQGDIFYSEDISNQYESASSWGRFAAQAVPDSVTGLFENRALWYAAGSRSIELNYNSQDPEFPWAVSDPALPYGLGAPNSWANFDDINTVMYLSCTDKMWEVVKFQGRIQQSISQPYAAILNDRTLITHPETGKAWGLNMRGIPIYCLTFQQDNLTICYNLLQDHWFRWAYWTGAAYQSALINSYCYSKALKKHLVGDRRDTGKIFELTGTADDSADMRFELTSGHVGNWDVRSSGRLVFKCKRGAVTDSSTPTFLWQNRDNGNANFFTGRTVSLGPQTDKELFGSLNRIGVYQVRQHRIVYTGQKTDFIFAGADES